MAIQTIKGRNHWKDSRTYEAGLNNATEDSKQTVDAISLKDPGAENGGAVIILTRG
jgi:hypothetical protein